MADEVDLDALRPVSIAEIAARPNGGGVSGKAPNLFENWWNKNQQHFKNGCPRKEIAQAAWYACAESLGVYDD